MGLGSKIRTEASLGALLRSENLKAFWSNGLCRKRSEFGYSLRIFSIIDGPESSNLLAPPTKQTAILDRSNSSFLLLHDWVSADSFRLNTELGDGKTGYPEGLTEMLLACWKAWPSRKERIGAKEEEGLVGTEEMERKTRRESGGIIKKSKRQSRSEIHFVKYMLIFCGFFSISFFSWSSSSISITLGSCSQFVPYRNSQTKTSRLPLRLLLHSIFFSPLFLFLLASFLFSLVALVWKNIYGVTSCSWRIIIGHFCGIFAI